MEISAFLVFALALAVTAGSPGPSLAALVSNVLVRGWRAVLPFVAAMWVGELLWLSCALAGLSALAESFHWAFLIIKYLGVAYLAYLAWKMWHAPLVIDRAGTTSGGGSALRLFLAGLSVTLGNPKIMVFYLALLPSLIDLRGVTLVDWATLAATILVVLSVIDLSYVFLAAKARGLMQSRAALRLANRASALAMGTAAAAIATP